MKINKDVSNFIKWTFDNLLPPVIRDNQWFMGIWMSLLFGKKKNYFMEFKEKVPYLSKEQYQEYYSILADKHFETTTDLNKNSLAAVLDNIIGETVLDMGCGRGYLARQVFKRYKVDVTAIDLIVPKEDANIKYLTGEIENIPAEDNSFDTVLCTHTLEHIPNIAKAIEELRRVAKKRIILVVPREREYKYTFNLHIHFFPYSYSFHRLAGGKNAKCFNAGSDIVYIDDLE